MLMSKLLQNSILPLSIALSAFGCGKSAPSREEDTVTVNNDAATFADRVTDVNQTLEIVPAEEYRANLAAMPDVVSYVLKLVVDIKPPSINTLSVQADSISLNSKGVAVAYNIAGDTQSGAIDVFSIEGSKVTLKSELKYATRDVNGIFWADKYLYAVGADSAGTAHSYLSRIKMNGQYLSDKITETNLLG
ncbi:MAG: hypothetical protein H7318_15385 [Oligoflexus sp.]|nr:hypothetical protein [Oligoflexus sp.]